MHTKTIYLAVLGIAATLAAGDEPATNDAKPDLPEFSKLIHQIVVSQVPKVYEDTSGWGQTVPMPAKLRLPNLRTKIKVGDKWELPHGLWRKVRVRLPNPAKDINIVVRDLKRVTGKTFRLSLDADAAFRAEIDGQHWQKGLDLVGFTGLADAKIGLFLECDVAVTFDTKKFPPDVKIDPKVVTLKMELQDFTLRQVSMRRLGQVLEGDRAREVGNQVKGALQDLIRSYEPKAKDYANQAIAKSLKEGKGALSADGLLKALSPPAKEKK